MNIEDPCNPVIKLYPTEYQRISYKIENNSTTYPYSYSSHLVYENPYSETYPTYGYLPDILNRTFENLHGILLL